MSRGGIVEHLRTAHGYAAAEPGGSDHEPGRRGFAIALSDWPAWALRGLHAQDHDDYPAGTPVEGQAHRHDDADVWHCPAAGAG